MTEVLPVNKIVSEGSKWLNHRLVIEPIGDLGIVASSYLH